MQFSLRSLLLFMVICSLLLGLWAVYVQPFGSQKIAPGLHETVVEANRYVNFKFEYDQEKAVFHFNPRWKINIG